MINKEIIERILKFRDERDWKQFHTPENLAKSIAIESGELLECFQWNPKYDTDEVCDELADVLIYCVDMATELGIDINEIVNRKLEKNERKYPVKKAKGNATKYTKFKD